MLRSALPVGTRLTGKPIAQTHGVQWLAHRHARAILQRSYANSRPKASLNDSDAIVLPGTQSSTAPKPQPPPPGPILSPSPSSSTPATPTSNSVVPPQNVPLMPPTPPVHSKQTAPPTAIPRVSAASPIPSTLPTSPAPSADTTPQAASPPPPPPPPPPPAPRRRVGRFRRFLITVFLLSGLGYAGGVYYSLLSDNFHDFFTEYVPYGEDAVLYFEEREYRKRFPALTNPTSRPSASPENKITIPSKSGVSWKVAGDEHQTSDVSAKGAHNSATTNQATRADNAQQAPSSATGSEKKEAVQKAKVDAKTSESAKASTASELAKEEAASVQDLSSTGAERAAKSGRSRSRSSGRKTREKTDTSMRPPEVNEPSRIMPLEPIDPLKIRNADEPLVQDLVKILNDIITVVNNDGAAHKYNSTVVKAKSALADVGRRIISLKEAEKKAAEEKIRTSQSEFDTAAIELVRRLEGEIQRQESQWKEEFASAREEIVRLYHDRLETETSRAKELSEQRLRNQLLEQAVTLKKQFITEVTSRVETERNGRLAKLSDLSSSVSELEKLTADWNSVIDANLRTQHLQVAVEAVRSSLETADRPRPFVRELAALKEIASNDPVINAAIASINPTAYQRGVPTSAQLIDRFRRVAAEVRKAALLPEDAGVASHAASYVLSNFLFKKKGMTVGDDVESILTRTETLLEEGNLDDAAREMNGLQGWAKTLSWDWLSEARRVLEVRQALDVCATQARLEGLRVDG